ncbi:bifunctional aminoglycoside phosphotransferase/ATP-binding protein [soil metagenome]
MFVGDQTAAVKFLSDPSTYGQDAPLEIIETHISAIFLAADRAYKMKRAVKLPYADFSTPALRLAACEQEIALNSLTAPDIYLRVRRITRERSGELVFDGTGKTIDAVVEMVRFNQSCLFDRLALAGKLTASLMTDTARAVALFHGDARIVHRGSGSANIRAVLDINRAGFATSHVFDPANVNELDSASRSALDRCAGLLDNRERAGKVRRCHGDLHLRNICLFDGKPALFDCIEFNEQIATVDVLYDLAFLLMDLWHRGFHHHANLVMNRYLDETADEAGFVLLPFFMAIRAAVRAHVTATQIEESGRRDAELVASAYSYFDLARTLLRPEDARLIAVGGFSGSGKTTVAETLAPAVGHPPGARVLSTDRIRKALFGVSAETRLAADAYEARVSKEVYEILCRRGRDLLEAGGSVILEAVFDRPDRRAAVADLARGMPAAAYTPIWLDVNPATLAERVRNRRSGPSDATAKVLQTQLERGADEITWTRIPAGRSVSDVAASILRSLVPRAPDGQR